MMVEQNRSVPKQAGIVRPRWAATCAFAVGATLAMSFLSSLWGQSITGWVVVILVGISCAGLWWASGLRHSASRSLRWFAWFCTLPLLALYALWIYLAVAFGTLLAWTVPLWLLVFIMLAALVALLTALRPRDRWHVPVALPLGLWIAVVLSGWSREETLVRCDDFLALRAPVQLVAKNPQLKSCQPGEVRESGRFPRTIWQAPDGERIIFTTQGPKAESAITGSVCEATLDGDSLPRCVGPPSGKSQGIIDLPQLERLLVMQWGIETPSGSRGAVIFELPRNDGIEILAEHWFDEMLGDGFYEPRNSTLYMFSDRMNGIHRARLPSFERLPTIPSDITPGELVYDRELGEGVACGHGTGTAIAGAPYKERYLAEGSTSVIEKISLSWGCDWDREARKVYSTIPNLGLLDRIDYDTGRVEKRWFVGLGKRSVAYDKERRRVYFTDFLRGSVSALDETTGRIVGHWFVGRFSRWVQLTRDGRALLATGNLGVVRIPLDG